MRNGPFKMKGYSYPGKTPIRKVGDYEVTAADIAAAKAGGASKETIEKLQDSKNRSDQKKKNIEAGKKKLTATNDPKKKKKLEEGIKKVKKS
tara:strand:+ start:1100 stop:1375 length:276 start_codon:yes stop_codon:yes gene_type:complete